MKKGTLYSVVKSKCPKCNQGDLWIKKNAYSIGFDKMHENCSNCGLKYDMEQGFWYGAMYVSYAFGVALSVAVVIALSVLAPEMKLFEKIIYALVFLILLMPVNFRYSRNIWLAIFVRPDFKIIHPEQSSQVKEKKGN